MQFNVNHFESIYRKYFKQISQFVIFKVPQMSDAEDVVSSVFTNLYIQLRKKSLEIDNIEAYLIQITKNELSKFYKQKSKSILVDDDWEDKLETVVDDFDLEESIFNKFDLESIEKALLQLSVLDQRIITAKIKLDMSFKEIAQALSVKENSVKTRYYRALETLRQVCVKED